MAQSILCAVIRGSTFEKMSEEIEQALPHAALIEVRIDDFVEIDFALLKKIRERFSLPMIFTLRSFSQGGKYEGKKDARTQLLLALAALRPEYLDLEYDDPVEVITSCYPEIKILLSYHNFSETPTNFDDIYQEMRKKRASLYKMALFAQNSVDLMRFLVWKVKKHSLIGISMGTFGEVSRIASPLFGNSFTYASIDASQTTAPGQLSLAQMRKYQSLEKGSALYGLIGDPVVQSLSDRTHNELMKKLGLKALYVKMQVGREELAPFISYAKELFHGLSVTMPLKEAIIPFLDKIDPQAAEIGAVNTLCIKEGKIWGYNTDGKGALKALEKEELVYGKRMVILGAGGAARAIAYEAMRRGCEVILLNRNGERARVVAQVLGCRGDALSSLKQWRYDILVNATPTVFPIAIEDLLSGTVVMDIKTGEHSFLDAAEGRGCRIVSGYEMFREQALEQFALWFGIHDDARAHFPSHASGGPVSK